MIMLGTSNATFISNWNKTQLLPSVVNSSGGQLFCWPCLYKWLHVHVHYRECPVCKAPIEEEKLVPLYGYGKISDDTRSRSIPCINIPNRPTGQRPPMRSAAAPHPDPNLSVDQNPWLGGASVASTQFGNYTFSATIGGLFSFLNFHVHGLPETVGC